MSKSVIALVALLSIFFLVFLMNDDSVYGSKSAEKKSELVLKNESTFETRARQGDFQSARLLLDAYSQLNENLKLENLCRVLLENKVFPSKEHILNYYLAYSIASDCESREKSLFRENCSIDRIEESKNLYLKS